MRKVYILTGLILSCAMNVMAQEGNSAAVDKIENFKQHDPYGVSMAIIAMGVVFSALLILFLCFKWSGKAMNKGIKNPIKASASIKVTKDTPEGKKVIYEKSTGKAADDEVAAAIGLALFLAEDGMHDHEPEELTLVSASQAWTGCGTNHKQYPLRKF